MMEVGLEDDNGKLNYCCSDSTTGTQGSVLVSFMYQLLTIKLGSVSTGKRPETNYLYHQKRFQTEAYSGGVFMKKGAGFHDDWIETGRIVLAGYHVLFYRRPLFQWGCEWQKV